jgi:release factor glutamine methyltransferase
VRTGRSAFGLSEAQDRTWGVRLLPVPGVFRPHSDSWLLARQVMREPLPDGAAVLDVCAGSGLLAVVAASRAASRVVAIDISRRATLAVRLNAKLNGLTVRAVRGDLFEPVRGVRFDLIVSNPPYLPSAEDELPRHGPARAWEGGPGGRTLIDRICARAPAHLRPGGVLLMVHSSVCGEHATLAALSRRGLAAEVIARSVGPLGPRLRARADGLRARGLLGAHGCEEMLVVRALASR